MSATPILDLEQPPPEPRPARRWLSALIGLVSGAATLAILVLKDEGKLPNWHWPDFNGLLLIPALWVSIAIHELGHLVAGKLAGVDTGGISVGPLVLLKSGRNWVFRFDRRRWAGGFFKPLTATTGLNPLPFVWMVAGGPLASILLIAVCGLTGLQYGDGAWEWIGTLFWAGLFTAIVSLIPFSAGMSKSDGARLWQFTRHPAGARSVMALLGIQTEETAGVRPREWSAELFEEALRIDDSTREYAYCQLLAFYRRFDEGSETAALQHLENALAKSRHAGQPVRHALFLEAACASAMIRRQAEQARTWRARASRLRKEVSPLVLDAELAMCDGRYAEAVPHWEAARAYLDRLRLDSGLIRFAREKWAGYEAECRAAEAKSTAVT